MTGFTAFILSALLLVPAFLVAIPVHEMGHALAAYFLGDRSVRYFGYLKPDPRRFLDPIGVIAVFVALVGWGKRVPIQSNRVSGVVRRLIYELGGPAANLVVAVAVGALLRAMLQAGVTASLTFSVGLIAAALFVIVFLNLSIFAFQLIPIPGLDGWGVIEALFRGRYPRFFFNVDSRRREVWVAAVIAIFVFQLLWGTSLLALVMTPAYAPASLISLGTCAGYGIRGFNLLVPCPP